jgi:hypothetical protein
MDVPGENFELWGHKSVLRCAVTKTKRTPKWQKRLTIKKRF